MYKKQTSPKLLQAELLPTQEEQVPANPNPPPRNRQLDSDDDAEPRTKRARTTRPTSEPARLTRKNLALFNKMVNPKKTSTHRDSDDMPTTKSLSSTSSGFCMRVYENGILNPFNSKPPTNLQEIYTRLARRRATASPPKSDYRSYTNNVGKAGNEATIVVETSEKLLKKYNDDDGYNRAYNRPFTGLPKDAGFNNGLSAPQPDFVEGLGMHEYRPFPVEKHISGAVLYKDDCHSVTLPHIAGEWKGPDGRMADATLQSSYDGAALVYARNQARKYSGKSDPAGYAHVTTFTTNGAQLNFYAHYAAPSEDGALEYHQYRVKTINLTGSYQEYKEGRKYLRNEQDHAREQSYELKDELKEHYKKQRGSGL
ncbi:hypothetical protein B0T19DRAFT_406656 [Cercophora scortea]|uniref:Uncharacterized protein n=1 Tax=Cercophora scortea TaxID=314031 RepID=A0AAE0MLL0_9PEZI|nr:hypothetical protein B0T19DRAFT_406656 [Cercophora scortea]